MYILNYLVKIIFAHVNKFFGKGCPNNFTGVKIIVPGLQNYCAWVSGIIGKGCQNNCTRVKINVPGLQNYCAGVSRIIGKGCQNNWPEVARTSTFARSALYIS